MCKYSLMQVVFLAHSGALSVANSSSDPHSDPCLQCVRVQRVNALCGMLCALRRKAVAVYNLRVQSTAVVAAAEEQATADGTIVEKGKDATNKMAVDKAAAKKTKRGSKSKAMPTNARQQLLTKFCHSPAALIASFAGLWPAGLAT
jgi:hypothetical protein